MLTCCGGYPAVLFPHKFDLYTANSVQNLYGELENSWIKYGTYVCNLDNIRGEKLDPIANMTYDPDADLLSPKLLLTPGRVLQEIFITNIVDRAGTKLWFEPHNGINNNTIFEVRSFVPSINVLGKLSHYKYKIVRSQRQSVVLA